MGLFSFGKKKEVDEEYFPDSPDRIIDVKLPKSDETRLFTIDFISVYVAKLFRNVLYAVDKLDTIENKIDKVLQENYNLQEKNKQLIEEIEYLKKRG